MKIVLSLVLSLILSSCATRLVTLNNSIHYQSRDFNESHSGIGVEVNVKNDWWIGFLRYKNSFNNTSNMITFSQEWQISDRWFWGAKMGFADGYDPITPLAAIGGATLRFNFLGPISYYQFLTPILLADGFMVELN